MSATCVSERLCKVSPPSEFVRVTSSVAHNKRRQMLSFASEQVASVLDSVNVLL